MASPTGQHDHAGPRPWHRLHFSSWVVLALAFLLIAVWNLSGFVFVDVRLELPLWRHGWPLTYLIRSVEFTPTFAQRTTTHVGVPPRPERILGLTQEVRSFRPAALAINCAVGLALAVVVALAFEWRRRRRPGPLSFSLKEFLAVVALVAAGVVYWQHLQFKHRVTLSAIEGIAGDRLDHCVDHGTPGWLWVLLPGESFKIGDKFTRIETLFPALPDQESKIDYRARFEKLPDLRGLDVGFSPPAGTAEALRALDKLVALDAFPFTDADLVHVAALPRLEELWIGQATDAGLVHLSQCKRLESLRLGDRVSDAGLAHLTQVSSLKRLTLCGDHIVGPGLSHLSRLPRLEDLYLTNVHINDEGWLHIGRLTRLKRLAITDSQFTDERFAQLRHLSRLEHLGLAGTAVTDRGLATLASFPALRSLILPTNVSDEGLTHLLGLDHLTYFHVRSSAVTDHGLKVIAALPSLRECALYQTGVTVQGIANLRQARPVLTIRQ